MLCFRTQSRRAKNSPPGNHLSLGKICNDWMVSGCLRGEIGRKEGGVPKGLLAEYQDHQLTCYSLSSSVKNGMHTESCLLQSKSWNMSVAVKPQHFLSRKIFWFMLHFSQFITFFAQGVVCKCLQTSQLHPWKLHLIHLCNQFYVSSCQ